MPPISDSLLPTTTGPRLILYAQTHHQNGAPVSLLPLITNQTGLTHVIVAAIHLNEGPGNITLNDDPPEAPKYETLWSEVRLLQGAGIKVMGMLGGAAKGSYWRLQGSDNEFEAYYAPLRDMIRRHNLDGLDLDVEEEIALPTLLRLLMRLRADFGSDFITTLAPVATALLPNMQLPPTTYTPPLPVLPTDIPSPSAGIPLTVPHSLPHLSGFSHFALEAGHSSLVNWYNVQFYNGWGDASKTAFYDAILAAGWPPSKVVLGVLTNQGNGGSGYVAPRMLEDVVRVLRARKPDAFAGVMGWEYFNAAPHVGEADMADMEGTLTSQPWEWAQRLGRVVRTALPALPGHAEAGRGVERPSERASGAGPMPLPETQVPWPPEKVQQLVDLGFGRPRVVAALNATGGDVEVAAGLLFEE
ncbi:glycoside hydrolase family 18 protein [Aplosporella prunicola CBS 121167]|uniref:Glycoside hydrolase family 18 protein n=1 Tax=Aplosporella prunicola CBS 121167 TaxID=1176127 RepID=A0A6A6AYN6_9PEZI|nr:glycoside hydrolase family 18 protein [Aplosporella prunicola CBS 121167]KAF2135887.1 glycoside hydrolase family 18 protein [Aplosporella prunicola CBS 121167]